MAMAVTEDGKQLRFRFKDKHGLFLPAAQPRARCGDFEIVRVRKLKPIRAFIARNHYSGGNAQVTRAFELRGAQGRLVGGATFGNVARTWVPPYGPASAWLCLNRFVLEDAVPMNGETLYLGECFAQLGKEGFLGVVSFSDPVPRSRRSGRVVFAGHYGAIYIAHNGVYTGRSKSETKLLLPNGNLYESRAANKIKAGDQGHDYATEILRRAGARAMRKGEDPATWLAQAKAAVCRPFLHPGNFRYIWGLNKRVKKHLPAQTEPYPKLVIPRASVGKPRSTPK